MGAARRVLRGSAHSPIARAACGAQMDTPSLPMAFDISLAVRTGDRDRRDVLNGIIERRRADIDAILAEYGVPRVAREGS